MTINLLSQFLGWCALINMAILSVWFLLIKFAHDWIYDLHSQWFDSLRKERFYAIHYAGMLSFKMVVIVFNVTPYLALLLLS